jgi:hypothetical protein
MQNKNKNNNMTITENFKITEKSLASSVEKKCHYTIKKLQQLDTFNLAFASSKNPLIVSKDEIQ